MAVGAYTKYRRAFSLRSPAENFKLKGFLCPDQYKNSDLTAILVTWADSCLGIFDKLSWVELHDFFASRELWQRNNTLNEDERSILKYIKEDTWLGVGNSYYLSHGELFPQFSDELKEEVSELNLRSAFSGWVRCIKNLILRPDSYFKEISSSKASTQKIRRERKHAKRDLPYPYFFSEEFGGLSRTAAEKKYPEISKDKEISSQ